MSAERTELINALQYNDAKSIQSLVNAGVPIHLSTEAPHHSHTPLQHALSLSQPQPLHHLLTAFFSSSHPTHLQSKAAVIDELISHLYPNQPLSVEETKEGLSSEDEGFNSVESAISALSRGEFIVVTDGSDRENEGDLIIAAASVTAEKIAFMVNETSGIICVGLTAARCSELQLPQMVLNNTESHQTAFTVSVDYKIGTTTGISAADRSATIRALDDNSTQPQQLSRPGHIFPLQAREGGVLTRPGHTEASVDLARLAGFAPVGVMCEIVNKDGSMARPQQLKQWSQRHGLQIISIKQLIEYRTQTEKLQQP